jgi:hypothetical protein
MIWVILVGIVSFIFIYVSIRLVGALLIAFVQALAVVLNIIADIGDWYQHRRRIRKMGLAAVAGALYRCQKPVTLIDRGDGLYVPSKGEW